MTGSAKWTKWVQTIPNRKMLNILACVQCIGYLATFSKLYNVANTL